MQWTPPPPNRLPRISNFIQNPLKFRGFLFILRPAMSNRYPQHPMYFGGIIGGTLTPLEGDTPNGTKRYSGS